MAQRFLLLHGTPLSPQVWDGVRAHLTADAVAPDLNELIEGVAMSRRCLQTEVAAAVLAALPDDEMVVVGHSFGGQVAIEVALLAPARLARLIVICSRHTPFPAFADGARAVRACRPVDVDARLRRLFTPRELTAAGPAVAYARRQLQTAPRGPWAASLDAAATYDRTFSVGRIAAPVSLFAAGIDEVSPPGVMAALAAALPRATLEVVSTWAHMSPFADPAGFADRLLAAGVEPPCDRQLPSTP
jgi:pimeloyl-ACP methyl ester carboxylesterase